MIVLLPSAGVPKGLSNDQGKERLDCFHAFTNSVFCISIFHLGEAL